MGPEFFQTLMGKSFYQGSVPNIAKSLEEISVQLKRANDLREKELVQARPLETFDKGGE